MSGRKLASSILSLLVIASAALSFLGIAGHASAQASLHDPILIVGDGDFKKVNGVNGGSGTPSDPYIIDNWDIGGTSTENCIEIRDTTAYFVIRNCTLQISDGVVLSNAANGSVTNVTSYACRASVRIENCTDISIGACHLDSADHGVYANNSARVEILDSIITNNAWGLYVDLSSYVYFVNNTLGVTNVGFSLHRSSDVTCVNNSLWSTQNAAVMDGMTYSGFEDNNVTIYSGDGVQVTGSDNFTIALNDIATVDVPSWIESWGIRVSGSENVTVYSNTIAARATGIITENSVNSVVMDNDISWGSLGIWDAGSNSSYLYNNAIASMDNGVLASDSVNCTVWDNNISVKNTAIALERSRESAVIDNTATTSVWPDYAIRAASCTDLLIWNNSRLNPSYLYLDSCVDATIYENNLSENALVSLDRCDGAVLLNNTISSSDTDVRVRWSTETYVIGNTFYAPDWAVRMESCQGGVAYDNIFPAEPGGNETAKSLYGFDFSYSWDIVVWSNFFDNFEIGVGVSYSTNITVYENDFTRSSVNMYSSPGCLVLNNTFRDSSGVGALYDCSYSEIVGNYFPDGGVVSLYDALGLGLYENVFVGGGVAIWGSDLAVYNSHYIASDNLVNGKPILQVLDSSGVDINGIDVGELIVVNSEFVNISGLNTSDCYIGMLIAYCANVTIQNNTVANDSIGIRLFNNMGLMVDHNRFITDGVGDHVYIEFTDARFNLTYPGGGNSWSDYAGVDLYHGPGQNISGPDGYGDTPYDSYGIVVDYYPIVGPFVNYPPVAEFTYSPLAGDITTLYLFNASSSHDDEDSNDALEVRWDWDGDGTWDTDWSSNMSAEHLFALPGDYTVRLEIRDSMGATDLTELQVIVVEEIPEFNVILAPVLSMLLLLPVMAGIARARRR